MSTYNLKITEEAVQDILKNIKQGYYKELLEYSFIHGQDDVKLHLKVLCESKDGTDSIGEIHLSFKETMY